LSSGLSGRGWPFRSKQGKPVEESGGSAGYQPVRQLVPNPLEAGGVFDRLRGMRLLERSKDWRVPSFVRRTVAISIEGTTLRILVVRDNVVESWLAAPLEERVCRGGLIFDPVALGARIDEIRERFDIPKGRIAWALSSRQVTARVLDLPGLRGKELQSAVNDEAQRLMGAGPEDNFLHATRLDGRIRNRGVFVVAVPKVAVLTALEAMDGAGLRPWTMDVRSLALIRAIGRPNAVILNLEEDGLDLAIVERGIPTLLRSVPLPSGIDLAIAQDRLVDEAERALGYYEDINPDRPLDPETPLYLTGSLATGIALSERVRAVTRHPIGRVTTALSHPADFPVGEYLVNLGLAVKHL